MSEENRKRPYVRKKRAPRKTKKRVIRDIDVAKKMLNIYQSAQDRKIEFNLSFEYTKKILLEETCYYTGRTFEDDGLFSRSFDRIDSDKGYVDGNIVACTVDFNQKKSNISIEEIKILYDKLVKPNSSEPI